MRKIREKIKEEFLKFDTVNELIFTTYNFEAQFFEEYIITYLMDIEKISTIAALNKVNQWIKEHAVAVFYDKSAISDLDSYITLDTYPVTIPKGVFHPKIILMIGQKKGKFCGHLFVSSANLTYAAYGSNIEGVADIDINSKIISNSLKGFLSQLFNKTGINFKEKYPITLHFLQQRKFDDNRDVEFFYNFGEQKIKLYPKITNYKCDGDVVIISPYFCCDFEHMIEGFKNHHIQVIPSLERDKYNIEKAVYKRCRTKGIQFSQINSQRFSHAKIINIGNYIIVGSHNFTRSALYDLNAEASLICKTNKNILSSIDLVEAAEKYFPENSSDIQNADENLQSRCPEEVGILVDWAEKKIQVSFRNIKETCNVQLGTFDICKLHAGDKSPKNVLFSKVYCQNGTIKFDELILTNKIYRVFKNKQEIIRGLINEINWNECRPEMKCGTLDQALNEWFYATNISDIENRAMEQVLPSIGSELEEKECNESIATDNGEQDIFDNYFNIFKSMNSLKSSINLIKDNKEIELYRIYAKAPGSICNIKELLEKIESNDIIRKWIISNELLLAIYTIKKKYKSIPTEKRMITTFRNEINLTIRELNKESSILESLIKNHSKKWNDRYFEWLKLEFNYKR